MSFVSLSFSTSDILGQIIWGWKERKQRRKWGLAVLSSIGFSIASLVSVLDASANLP